MYPPKSLHPVWVNSVKDQNFSFRKFCAIFSTLFFILIGFNSFSQTNNSFVNQFSASQQRNYSKLISLLPYASIGDLVSQGKSVTILMQDDAFFNRLSEKDNLLLFIQHDVTAINLFFNTYCIEGSWTIPAISGAVNANNKYLQLQNRNGSIIQFSRHLSSFLVELQNSFEANIIGSQNINQSIFLFL